MTNGHQCAPPTAAQVNAALRGTVYPALPADLVATARRNDAPRLVVDALAALPLHPIIGPNQVWRTILHSWERPEGRHDQPQGEQ